MAMAMLVLSLMLTLMVISGVIDVRLLMNRAERNDAKPDRKGDEPTGF